MASQINPVITANKGAARLALAFLWLTGAGFGCASAEDVPLPKSRPSVWMEPHTFREAAGPDFDSAHVTSAPTECDQRLRAIAAIEPVPRADRPGCVRRRGYGAAGCRDPARRRAHRTQTGAGSAVCLCRICRQLASRRS